MDEKHFDNLVKDLTAPGPRRALIRFLVALPLLGGLDTLLAGGADARDRRKRRKARHRHRTGDRKNNRNGGAKIQKKCASIGQTPQQGRRKQCCQGLVPDSTGRCAALSPPPPPSAPCGNACTGSEICVGETCCLPASVDLQTAVAAAVPGATLTLCAGTWTLTSTLDIPKNLTLIGAGAGQTILDGGDAVRVLQIVTNVTVTIEDLTITNGLATGLSPLSRGGGVYNDGGTVTVRDVVVTDNHADFTGGGIENATGTMTLVGVAVTNNSAGFLGGGIYDRNGTLTLQAGSSITGNTASADAGGILTEGGPVTLAADTIVCGNSGPDQCLGPITGACPNPADGICPA
jgi:hypothetical protein